VNTSTKAELLKEQLASLPGLKLKHLLVQDESEIWAAYIRAITDPDQPIPGLDKMNFAALAKASGIPKAYEYDALDAFEKDFPELLKEDGPIFINLKVIPPRTEPPPGRSVPIAEAAQNLRRMFTKN